MPDSFSTGSAPKAQQILKAACLSAALATAFAAPAHAAVAVPPNEIVAAPTDFQTSDGTQIQDGYYIETTNFFTNTTPAGTVDGIFPTEYSPLPVVGSQPADTPDLDSVVVFTQSPNSLIGEDFAAAFLAGTSYTESEVADYIGSGFTDTNTNDSGAYNTFVTSLVNNYGTANTATDPINAFVFTGGKAAGTVSAAQLSLSGASSPYVGFGLTPNATAVPEPGALPLLMLGGAALAGWTVSRRRRITA